MNLQLDDVELFVRIAALGTLSAAARERDMAVSQATRSPPRPEARCGGRLGPRRTHGPRLTHEDPTVATR